MKKFLYLLLLSVGFTSACTNLSETKLDTPIPNLISSPAAQVFQIDPNQDTVLIGEFGTLLAIEAGTFVDKDGNVFTKPITLELKEALSISQMIEHGLTTQTDDGKLLQSGGMINLTAKEDVQIAKPIHTEVPTTEKLADMSLYEGNVSSNGQVAWKEEQKLENWLIEVPIESLNFYPTEDHTVAGVFKVKSIIPKEKIRTLETFHLGDSIITTYQDFREQSIFKLVQSDVDAYPSYRCGISKYILQGLNNKKFEGTFVATNEFAERVRKMNECCGDEIIKIYLQNLTKNLWEADEQVVKYLKEKQRCQVSVYEAFAALKQTTVKPKDKINRALRKHIEKLFQAKEKAWAKFNKDLKKWDSKRQELETEVVDKLEREATFRNRLSYVFDTKKFGWWNVDRLLKYPSVEWVKLHVQVKDLAIEDAGHVILIFPKDKALFDLSRAQDGSFFAHQNGKAAMQMPLGAQIVVKAIVEKAGQLHTNEKELTVEKDMEVKLGISKTTDEQVAAQLKKYEQETVTVSMDTVARLGDESFATTMTTFIRTDATIDVIQNRLEEHYKTKPVWDDYEPCCYQTDLVKGKEIFETQCQHCHGFYDEVVGGALVSPLTSNRFSLPMWISFIKYPEKFITSGNAYAKQLYDKYGQMMPNHDHLSDDEVASVIEYIKKQQKK